MPTTVKREAGKTASTLRVKRVVIGGESGVPVFYRCGHEEASKKLAGDIISNAEKRTEGISAKKLLSNARNRRA